MAEKNLLDQDNTSTTSELAKKRYGDPAYQEALVSGPVVDLIVKRRSVRTFLPEPIDDAVLRTLVMAAQSAPTGLNFQNWSVVVVRDKDRRDRLAELSDHQQMVRDAPLFLVWIADWARACSIAEWNNAPSEGSEFLDSTISTVTDATLAAQNAALAAESLGYGTCYVGALRNNLEEVSQELGLPDYTFPLFGLVIGRPDPSDKADIKPRLPQDVVLHEEQYHAAEPERIAVFEERVGTYYASQGIPRSWIASVLQRMRGFDSLHGRHRIRKILSDRGLLSR